MGERINSVCVIGLGTVGAPTSEYFAGRGMPTYGCDLNPGALKPLEGRLTRVATRLSDLPLADLYVITVDSRLQGTVPAVGNVYRACESIAALTSPPLVSIESTVPVGTCDKIYAEVFGMRGNLVHIPHRWWAEDTLHHGVAQPRVVGSVNPEGIGLAMDFYGSVGISLLPVRDIRVAEACKIAENTDRYLRIAYAELLWMVCIEHGLDFTELRGAMNSKWNTEILEARDGIGGTCLPKDIHYLRAAAPHLCHLLDGAIAVDSMYRSVIAKRERGLQQASQ